MLDLDGRKGGHLTAAPDSLAPATPGRRGGSAPAPLDTPHSGGAPRSGAAPPSKNRPRRRGGKGKSAKGCEKENEPPELLLEGRGVPGGGGARGGGGGGGGGGGAADLRRVRLVSFSYRKRKQHLPFAHRVFDARVLAHPAIRADLKTRCGMLRNVAPSRPYVVCWDDDDVADAKRRSKRRRRTHGAVASRQQELRKEDRRERRKADFLADVRDAAGDLRGRKRVIQRRFKVGVPRAGGPDKTFTLRDCSER